jgi:hypothetical protein
MRTFAKFFWRYRWRSLIVGALLFLAWLYDYPWNYSNGYLLRIPGGYAVDMTVSVDVRGETVTARRRVRCHQNLCLHPELCIGKLKTTQNIGWITEPVPGGGYLAFIAPWVCGPPSEATGTIQPVMRHGGMDQLNWVDDPQAPTIIESYWGENPLVEPDAMPPCAREDRVDVTSMRADAKRAPSSLFGFDSIEKRPEWLLSSWKRRGQASGIYVSGSMTTVPPEVWRRSPYFSKLVKQRSKNFMIQARVDQKTQSQLNDIAGEGESSYLLSMKKARAQMPAFALRNLDSGVAEFDKCPNEYLSNRIFIKCIEGELSEYCQNMINSSNNTYKIIGSTAGQYIDFKVDSDPDNIAIEYDKSKDLLHLYSISSVSY